MCFPGSLYLRPCSLTPHGVSPPLVHEGGPRSYGLLPPRGWSVTHQDRCLLQGLWMELGSDDQGCGGGQQDRKEVLSFSQVPCPLHSNPSLMYMN